MNKNSRNMVIVFAGFFFLSLFSNTLSPFITTIKNTYNVSSDTIAILPPVVYFASFIMSIVGSKLMSVLGLKKGLYLGLLFAIFASIIILFSKTFYILLLYPKPYLSNQTLPQNNEELTIKNYELLLKILQLFSINYSLLIINFIYFLHYTINKEMEDKSPHFLK
jgi:MFS family permease